MLVWRPWAADEPVTPHTSEQGSHMRCMMFNMQDEQSIGHQRKAFHGPQLHLPGSFVYQVHQEDPQVQS